MSKADKIWALMDAFHEAGGLFTPEELRAVAGLDRFEGYPRGEKLNEAVKRWLQDLVREGAPEKKLTYLFASLGSQRKPALRQQIEVLHPAGQAIGVVRKGVLLERETLALSLKASMQLDERGVPLTADVKQKKIKQLRKLFRSQLNAATLVLLSNAAEKELPIYLSGTGQNPHMLGAIHRLADQGYERSVVAVIAPRKEKLKRAPTILAARSEEYDDNLEGVKAEIVKQHEAFKTHLPAHLAFAHNAKIINLDPDFREGDMLSHQFPLVAERKGSVWKIGKPEIFDAFIKSHKFDPRDIQHDPSVALPGLGY